MAGPTSLLHQLHPDGAGFTCPVSAVQAGNEWDWVLQPGSTLAPFLARRAIAPPRAWTHFLAQDTAPAALHLRASRGDHAHLDALAPFAARPLAAYQKRSVATAFFTNPFASSKHADAGVGHMGAKAGAASQGNATASSHGESGAAHAAGQTAGGSPDLSASHGPQGAHASADSSQTGHVSNAATGAAASPGGENSVNKDTNVEKGSSEHGARGGHSGAQGEHTPASDTIAAHKDEKGAQLPSEKAAAARATARGDDTAKEDNQPEQEESDQGDKDKGAKGTQDSDAQTVVAPEAGAESGHADADAEHKGEKAVAVEHAALKKEGQE
mmetsp:Transcript_41965/g.115777  ORF Transcript_41965/g.115777 Transcript_41965/m.115777 type:complete len:327 (+) Transcript_41965:67-1047(+)